MIKGYGHTVVAVLFALCVFSSVVSGCQPKQDNSITSSYSKVPQSVDEAKNAMLRANAAGVPPSLSAAREQAANKAINDRLTQLSQLRQKGSVTDDFALRAINDAQAKHKIALKRMRDSLYKEPYVPGW